MKNHTQILVPLFFAAFVAGCGDSSEGASSGGPAGGNPPTGPLYALTTQIFGADEGETQSYLLLTNTLDSQAPLSLDKGLEIPGRALNFGVEDTGVVFVASDDGPTITKYALQSDGSLSQAGDPITFLGKGVSYIGEYQGQVQFVSETKAYYFDGPTAQVIIWDPKNMAVTGSIALAELVMPDTTLTFTAAPLRRGDEVITFAGLRAGPEVPSVAAVVVVDSKTDKATIVKDTRCGYVRDGVEADDGKIYMATEAYGASVHRLNPENAAAPCMLRFDPATNQFDPAFHVELNTLFDGKAAGSLLRGPKGEPYLRVLDETAFEIMPDTHPRVLASAPAWKWASVTLGDKPAATVLDAETNNGSVIPLSLGDRRFVALYQGQDSTKFFEIAASGPTTSTLSSPGLVFSALKLR